MARGVESAPAESLERSARFWLRAYPRRWRAAFGDDFVGVLAETADRDRRRVGTSEAAAIIRAGWALRLREHPPLLRWLGYRILDVRLPLRYQHWVVDDIMGPLYPARLNLGLFPLIAAMGIWQASDTRTGTEMLPIVASYAAIFIVCTLIMLTPAGRSRRRAAWQRHVSPAIPWSLMATRDKARTARAARSVR